MAVTRDDLASLSPPSHSLRSIAATFFGTFRAPDRKRVESMEIAGGKSGLILEEGEEGWKDCVTSRKGETAERGRE